MSENKRTTYLAPISSFGLADAKIPFARPGRYHGFDTWVIDTGSGSTELPIRVGHSTGAKGSKPFTSKQNGFDQTGSFVTRQGLVANTVWLNTLTEGIPIEIPKNSSGATKYYVLFASYTWVDAEGGAAVEYGVYVFTPADPLNIDPYDGLASPAIEVDLGYFEVLSDPTPAYGHIEYFPNDTPQFAWADEPKFDPSLYAVLAGSNHFQKTNYAKLLARDNTHVIDDGSGYNFLTLDGSTNMVEVTLNSNTTIHGINDLEASTLKSTFYIVTFNIGSNLVYLQNSSDENRLEIPGLGLGYTLKVEDQQTFIFMKHKVGSINQYRLAATYLYDLEKTWTEVTPTSPWGFGFVPDTNERLKYRVDNTGQLQLLGTITSDTVSPTNLITTLPSAFWPKAIRYFPVVKRATGEIFEALLQTNGDLKITGTDGNANISFCVTIPLS